MQTTDFNPANLHVYDIKTVQEIKDFLSYLLNYRSIAIHPDDRFEDYIDNSSGEPVFTPNECLYFNKWIRQSIAVCEIQCINIYHLLDEAMGVILVEQPQMRKPKIKQVYNIALSSLTFNFGAIDGTKVHGVEDCGGGHMEQCDDDEADIFSVFVHLKNGGLKCIFDCENKDDAQAIAALIDRIIEQATK